MRSASGGRVWVDVSLSRRAVDSGRSCPDGRRGHLWSLISWMWLLILAALGMSTVGWSWIDPGGRLWNRVRVVNWQDDGRGGWGLNRRGAGAPGSRVRSLRGVSSWVSGKHRHLARAPDWVASWQCIALGCLDRRDGHRSVSGAATCTSLAVVRNGKSVGHGRSSVLNDVCQDLGVLESDGTLDSWVDSERLVEAIGRGNDGVLHSHSRRISSMVDGHSAVLEAWGGLDSVVHSQSGWIKGHSSVHEDGRGLSGMVHGQGSWIDGMINRDSPVHDLWSSLDGVINSNGPVHDNWIRSESAVHGNGVGSVVHNDGSWNDDLACAGDES